MLVILRVATVVPAFQDYLPPDIEEAILLGKQNLHRFAKKRRPVQVAHPSP